MQKRLKIGPEFLPTLPQFCILLDCQANSQTEMNQALPNDRK